MVEYSLVSSYFNRDATFRVIKPQWEGAGIFSYVWGVLQSIYTYPNDKYYIDMTKWSPYYEPSIITHTENVWEYYFKQPDIETYPKRNDIIDVGAWMDEPTGFAEFYDKPPIPREKRIIYNRLIKRYIIPQPHIQKKIDDFVAKHEMKQKKILGVHWRGSSKNTTQFAVDSLVSPEIYLKEIEAVEKNYDAIFMISDSTEGIEPLQKRFGDRFIPPYEAFRPEVDTKNAMRCSADGHKLQNRYQSGEDAVVESYLLSHSSFIICASSNVSTFARYANYDLNVNMNYIDLYCKHSLFKIR